MGRKKKEVKKVTVSAGVLKLLPEEYEVLRKYADNHSRKITDQIRHFVLVGLGLKG